ncbi:MAG: U32 family peptidase [Candidatus Omnitrophica bacterium]|nr:U32 family peptidase [Candidatus Omnitrophota bacterium]
MFKISVPTNWQDDLVIRVSKGEVDEFYGKLAQDCIGGGRPAYGLPQVSRQAAASHVDQVRKSGRAFNYLMNATCLDNAELTRRGQREIHALLDWLESIGVGSCTVSVPYLLEVVKKRSPHFKVYISTSSRVDSVERARNWEDLGADGIILDSVSANRDFSLLRRLRKGVKCELVLIANVDCLYGCPFRNYHCTAISHASQRGTISQGFFLDYSSLMCGYLRVKYPENFIRGDWIRPEDLGIYEKLGIDRIKLVDRTMPTEFIAGVTEAYLNRRYDGNLLDLFPNSRKKLMYKKVNLFSKMKYLFHPLRINLYRVSKIRELDFDMFYIDNRSLDGFLEHFVEKDCRLTSCRECGYCRDWAERTVKVDCLEREKLIERYEKYLSQVISGGIFRYV